MKKIIYTFLIMGVLTLAACSSDNQESSMFDKLTDSEKKHVEMAKEDLSLDEFNEAIESANRKTAKVNDTEVVDLFKGTNYYAYLLTRAKLSKESFEKAKEKDFFTAKLNYDDYKSVSDSLINRDEYQEMTDKDGGEGNYGAYVAKSVQYLTPEGYPG